MRHTTLFFCVSGFTAPLLTNFQQKSNVRNQFKNNRQRDVLALARMNCCLEEYGSSLCRLGVACHSLRLQLSSVPPVPKPSHVHHGTPHLCALHPGLQNSNSVKEGTQVGKSGSSHFLFPGLKSSIIFKANRPFSDGLKV